MIFNIDFKTDVEKFLLSTTTISTLLLEPTLKLFENLLCSSESLPLTWMNCEGRSQSTCRQRTATTRTKNHATLDMPIILRQPPTKGKYAEGRIQHRAAPSSKKDVDH